MREMMKSGKYGRNGRWPFIDPPWKLIPKGTNLLGNFFIPPRYGQVKEHNFQANVMKQKRIQCTYSNVLRIKVTHTMIPRLVTEISLIPLIKIFATDLMFCLTDLIHWGFLDAFYLQIWYSEGLWMRFSCVFEMFMVIACACCIFMV